MVHGYLLAVAQKYNLIVHITMRSTSLGMVLMVDTLFGYAMGARTGIILRGGGTLFQAISAG